MRDTFDIRLSGCMGGCKASDTFHMCVLGGGLDGGTQRTAGACTAEKLQRILGAFVLSWLALVGVCNI
jgi:hypothetical protein